MAYKKVRPRSEYETEIEELKKQNAKLMAENDRKQHEEWERLIPKATEVFQSQMGKTFPNMLKSPRFEHVDASGYWFTFELINDDRRQTYAIRHGDLKEG